MNWHFGWGMLLAAFLSGAVIGLFFHADDYLGGYGSFRRRILRLGHVALAALGMVNILYSLSSASAEPSLQRWLASTGFIVGGVTMPLLCFLSAWRAGFRHLFFVPVVALAIAVIQTLRLGPP